MGREGAAYRAGVIAQSLLYAASGVNHFWHESFYTHIMPDHYAHPAALVKLSGMAEILGGLGLLPRATRRFAAMGIAGMLVVFFDVHLFMLRRAERFPEVPVWVLWARIPLQLVLITWSLRYAGRESH
ncbi:MAG TPA: DoxX family protein [Acidobacteriaceae bacterium]|nr:DoxX family protein [Acidobacteriaceae bacterium]